MPKKEIIHRLCYFSIEKWHRNKIENFASIPLLYMEPMFHWQWGLDRALYIKPKQENLKTCRSMLSLYVPFPKTLEKFQSKQVLRILKFIFHYCKGFIPLCTLEVSFYFHFAPQCFNYKTLQSLLFSLLFSF